MNCNVPTCSTKAQAFCEDPQNIDLIPTLIRLDQEHPLCDGSGSVHAPDPGARKAVEVLQLMKQEVYANPDEQVRVIYENIYNQAMDGLDEMDAFKLRNDVPTFEDIESSMYR